MKQPDSAMRPCEKRIMWRVWKEKHLSSSFRTWTWMLPVSPLWPSHSDHGMGVSVGPCILSKYKGHMGPPVSRSPRNNGKNQISGSLRIAKPSLALKQSQVFSESFHPRSLGGRRIIRCDLPEETRREIWTRQKILDGSPVELNRRFMYCFKRCLNITKPPRRCHDSPG